MMKNLTKTLLLTSVFATASVIAMEEYNNGENHVQQPVRSQEMEAFRSTAEAVLGDDWYLNYFLQTEESTIESLVRYAYDMMGYGDNAAQEIHTALGNHAKSMEVDDIQKIIDDYEQEQKKVREERAAAIEAFRPIAEALLRDDYNDYYLNNFLQTEEPTIESLVRYSYLYAGYYGDDVAQQIHTALGNHANGMTVEDIQGIIDRVKQER